jgi:Flp pilus assembly protein TadD
MDVTANFNRAVMLLRLGRQAEAEQLLLKVLELSPNHALAREYLQRLQAGAASKP